MKKTLLSLLICSACALTSSLAVAQTSNDTPANNLPGVTTYVPPEQNGWKLVYSEDFTQPLDINSKPWVIDPMGKNSPWYVDEFSDDGKYFDVLGGPGFKRIIDSVNVMRKRVTFGQNNWLTVELAAQDDNKDGIPDSQPSLTETKGGALINVPAWNTGLIITNTKPLPEVYRLQYEIKMVDYGGKRDGKWAANGKFNGYTPTSSCKTNFPWARTDDYPQDGVIDPCAYPFGDVQRENGYYLLTIVDYPHPAPHNNILIHSHRKVGFDTYSAAASWGRHYQVCNPATGKLIPFLQSSGIGINQIFFDGNSFRDPRFAYNQFVMPTPCGLRIGDDPNASIVSIAELKPDLQPDQTYTVAIERNEKGYTMEITGDFPYIGHATFRNYRPFISPDGKTSIWHYNQKPSEYDGHLNQQLTFTGKYGQFTKDMWPQGSAYPDYFVIGTPHLNYYEGKALIENIRLYTK